MIRFYLILALFFFPFINAQCQSEHQLIKRTIKMSKTLEKIGIDQHSYGCRYYLLMASDRAAQSAERIMGAQYQAAYDLLIHVRNEIDYTYYCGCAHNYMIVEQKKEVRSILEAFSQ